MGECQPKTSKLKLPNEGDKVTWKWRNEAGTVFTRKGTFKNGWFDSGLDIFFDEVISWEITTK